MAPAQGPVVPRRRLGAELRELRDRAGLLLEDVADKLECSASKISRLETGKGIPKARDVRDMLDLYGVAERARRDRLLRWVRESQQQGWWSEFSDVLLTDHLDTFLALESEASSILEYQQAVVPGLLQTRPYARAIISVLAARRDEEQIDKLVKLRQERQRALTRREGPLRLRTIIDESVLHRRIGGADVVRAQLQALLTAGRRRSVDLRILPFSAGAHQALAGGFSVLRFDDAADRDVVYLERHLANSYLENPADVVTYERIFDEISRQALSAAESMDHIRSLADRARKRSDGHDLQVE